MKRFILFLVALLFTSVCFAQDVIVQKDGSTIQAKVLKVTQTEVEYKMYENQNGPTYTISTKNLQCINYENGTKDTFVSASYDPNIVTNETATQFSNDKTLLGIYNDRNKKVVTSEMKYKRGKRMKTAGFVLGGTFLAVGIISTITGVSKNKYDEHLTASWTNDIYHRKFYNKDRDKYITIGLGAMALGIFVGTPLIMEGISLQKKYKPQNNSVSAISHDINFRNGSNLNLGIDMLSDNHTYRTTPGIGVRYNF